MGTGSRRAGSAYASPQAKSTGGASAPASPCMSREKLLDMLITVLLIS